MLRYQNFFGINEIRKSKHLQAVYWALLIGFFLSFQQWIDLNQVTLQAAKEGKHICLPYFQNCENLYFFDGFPLSYGQNILYAVLSAFLLLSAIAAWRRRWDLAWLALWPPFLWKLLYVGLLTNSAHVDFEYFHIPPLLLFLLARDKLYFMRRGWVLVYLFAATMKFNESWIVGSYFTSLSLGMPLVSDSLVPFVSNGVAFFEILAPWFLLSSNRRLRYSVLGLWVLFHIYSITLVGFRYPLHCTPLLLALFLPQPSAHELMPKFNSRAWMGWLILAGLCFVSFVPRWIPGDKLYTLQGIKFGVGMFDANHQCVSTEIIEFEDGHSSTKVFNSGGAMQRCGPYPIFFRLQQICRREGVKAVGWKLLSSVNGGPFYQMVDVIDACKLDYKPFSSNDWIRDPSTGAEIRGYPRKNTHRRKTFSEEPLVYSSPDFFLTPLQEFLRKHLEAIVAFYWTLWALIFTYFILRRLGLWRRSFSEAPLL